MNPQTSHTYSVLTLTPFRDSVVGILIMLWTEWSSARIPVGAEIFFLQNVQTGAGVHPPYSMGTGMLSRGESGRGMMFTTRLHLTQHLRMCGATPLIPTQAFNVLPGMALTFLAIKGKICKLALRTLRQF
jgi:hypothetical protein